MAGPADGQQNSVPDETAGFLPDGRHVLILAAEQPLEERLGPPDMAQRERTEVNFLPEDLLNCATNLGDLQFTLRSEQPGPGQSRPHNAGPELLLEAGARHERTLEAVSSRPLLCG